MAEKGKGTTYEELIKDIKAKNFKPVYLFMGEESYFIDQLADAIVENSLDPSERDFNLDVLYGLDLKLDSKPVVEMAKAYPMMAARRVVILKEAQNMQATQLENIATYTEKPAPTTVLVICYKNGTIDSRKKLVKTIAANGAVFVSDKLKDDKFSKFLVGRMKMRGLLLEDKAAAMITESVGSDISRALSELEKVATTLSQGGRITPDIVEEKIGISKEYNIWELKSAIVNKDVVKTNRIMQYFASESRATKGEKNSAYAVLPMLFNYFQTLMIAYYAPDRNNPRSVAEYIGAKSDWAARDYVTGMRNYKGRKVLDILGKLREADARMKGIENGSASVIDLMRELVFFILH